MVFLKGIVAFSYYKKKQVYFQLKHWKKIEHSFWNA